VLGENVTGLRRSGTSSGGEDLPRLRGGVDGVGGIRAKATSRPRSPKVWSASLCPAGRRSVGGWGSD